MIKRKSKAYDKSSYNSCYEYWLKNAVLTAPNSTTTLIIFKFNYKTSKYNLEEFTETRVRGRITKDLLLNAFEDISCIGYYDIQEFISKLNMFMIPIYAMPFMFVIIILFGFFTRLYKISFVIDI